MKLFKLVTILICGLVLNVLVSQRIGILRMVCGVQILLCKPAGGRGASVSACADLTNQLQCCWVDPARAWKNTDEAIVGYRWTGVERRHALYC